MLPYTSAFSPHTHFFGKINNFIQEKIGRKNIHVSECLFLRVGTRKGESYPRRTCAHITRPCLCTISAIRTFEGFSFYSRRDFSSECGELNEIRRFFPHDDADGRRDVFILISLFRRRFPHQIKRPDAGKTNAGNFTERKPPRNGLVFQLHAIHWVRRNI